MPATMKDRQLKILIVEDEILAAVDLQMQLEARGHTVCGIAATEGDAVSQALTEKPDLMLVDVRLKDGDSGPSAVKAIRERIDPMVVFVTGNPNEVSQQGLVDDKVLHKPLRQEALESALLLAATRAEHDER